MFTIEQWVRAGVTFVIEGVTVGIMSQLEKWVTVGIMGHSWKNESQLKKMGHS